MSEPGPGSGGVARRDELRRPRVMDETRVEKTNKGRDPRGLYLLAAVRPHEPRGEHHLLVYCLLCHGGRAALRRSVRRAPRTRAVVGSNLTLTRMKKAKAGIFRFCRGKCAPARQVALGMGFSLDLAIPGATARRPHSSERDRRTERGTRAGSTPCFASVGVDTLGLVRRAHAAASSR